MQDDRTQRRGRPGRRPGVGLTVLVRGKISSVRRTGVFVASAIKAGRMTEMLVLTIVDARHPAFFTAEVELPEETSDEVKPGDGCVCSCKMLDGRLYADACINGSRVLATLESVVRPLQAALSGFASALREAAQHEGQKSTGEAPAQRGEDKPKEG